MDGELDLNFDWILSLFFEYFIAGTVFSIVAHIRKWIMFGSLTFTENKIDQWSNYSDILIEQVFTVWDLIGSLPPILLTQCQRWLRNGVLRANWKQYHKSRTCTGARHGFRLVWCLVLASDWTGWEAGYRAKCSDHCSRKAEPNFRGQ